MRRDRYTVQTDTEDAAACRDGAVIDRRALLAGSFASLTLWGFAPRAHAASADPRFLAIVLRGGLDGLAVVAPVADPHYEHLRGELALRAAGDGAGLPLGGGYILNPAMTFLHALFQKREALVVHAVATPYRERSHFDGQDVLESGLPGVGAISDGWLNRAIARMPVARKTKTAGLAMGTVVPLVMRGLTPVLSWSPKVLAREITQSTVARLKALYEATDPALAASLAKGIEVEGIVRSGSGAHPPQRQAGRARRDMVEAAQAAARLLASADGPRVGALSVSGWDTHANEGVTRGALHNRLGGLDHALQILAEGLGPAWRETVIVLVTEFGRTARTNGSNGTDHGTGTVAILLGGAVRGGRVVADWPGLSQRALHEGRDLKPTTDLRAVLKGVLGDHLALDQRILAEHVFPGSLAVRPLQGLVRS